MPEVEVSGRLIGTGHPVYVIAEIGINHNGDVDLARQLIDAALAAGCDAVKFQKRTPELCVPDAQKNVPRETPWGVLTYLEYRHRLEFDQAAYREIDGYCKEKAITWFASCWDIPSVDFIQQFDPPCYKISSACLTDDRLLAHTAGRNRPVILSTGMSTLEQIKHAVSLLRPAQTLIAHCTSAYPCPPEELNLRTIAVLTSELGLPVGYSGHEVGLQTTTVAVVLGACFVERHITLNRAMWGSDQAASVEPGGFQRLVRDIRVIEKALGDGTKRVYESELVLRRRLRLVE